jgi:hypothetical protein
MLEILELEEEQKLIEGYINCFYEKGEEKLKPITDGVINVEKYLNSKYRICWVLKEPYDNIGGGWSLTERMNDDSLCKHDVIGSPSWEPLALVTYSLLNGFLPYTELLRRDISEMALSFQNIAYINIGKISADTKSYEYDIANKYKFWKPILHWQLKQYDPQIIIFGYTFQHFQKDLGILDNEVINNNLVGYTIKNKKIYLRAYHPAARVNKENYIQDIINVVKNNIKSIL